MKKIFVSPDKRFWLDEGINKVLARIEHMAFSKIGFVGSLIGFIFFSIMAISGGFADPAEDSSFASVVYTVFAIPLGIFCFGCYFQMQKEKKDLVGSPGEKDHAV